MLCIPYCCGKKLNRFIQTQRLGYNTLCSGNVTNQLYMVEVTSSFGYNNIIKSLNSIYSLTTLFMPHYCHSFLQLINSITLTESSFVFLVTECRVLKSSCTSRSTTPVRSSGSKSPARRSKSPGSGQHYYTHTHTHTHT